MNNVVRMEKTRGLSTPQVPIDGGGQPPYDGGMEQRIVAVEGRLSHVEDRLTRVETKLDHVDREVSQFKWWVAGSAVAIVLAMIATVLGTGVAIQQMTVASFQAASQLTQPSQPSQPPIIINVPPPPSLPPEKR